MDWLLGSMVIIGLWIAYRLGEYAAERRITQERERREAFHAKL